jgi:tetratricopeptide (TPR) repeat protein
MAASDVVAIAPTPAFRPAARDDGRPDPASMSGAWRSVLFIALSAALLASFPARNSDLWMHLASGQQLAHGGSTHAGLPVVAGAARHPTWLLDVFCYGLYSTVGAAGLVLGKVLIVVVLALVLLQVSRVGPEWGIAVACTALALLAMSTRLPLQPVTFSYLGLALALWFLRPHREVSGIERRILIPWPLLVLFVVWANVDRWFVLGLAVVGLAWLGRALDARGQRGGKLTSDAAQHRYFQLRLLPLSFALLCAACLLNPSHVRAFALPSELGWFTPSSTSGGPRATEWLTSPFQPAYFAHVGQTAAGLAYFPLLGLGLVTFLLNRSPWSWQRFLPWLGLALLSAMHARAIPLFAVVAGPTLAWNLHEIAERRRQFAEPGVAPRGLARSFVLALAAIAFVVCAWPGWLQSPPYEPRRWAVELPTSPEHAAATIRRWRAEGKLQPDKRMLHLSPETAYAFAWFCPEQHGLLDNRLMNAIVSDEGDAAGWAGRMRAANVDHVIVYDSDRGRLLTALERLLREPREWPLLYLEGDLAVFGWRDPKTPSAGRPDPFQGRELDLNRLAFHNVGDKKAPRQQPDRIAEPRAWWEAFWKPAPAQPIERNEATMYLLHAEASQRSAPYRRLHAWEAGQSAAFVGAAAGWTGPIDWADASLRLVLLRPPLPEPGGEVPPMSRMALACQQWYTMEQDDAPPALLYLAVRAARRALAVNPEDAEAWFVLGESYLRMLHGTRERAWGRSLPQLVQLRRAQASSALNRAIALKPDLAHAHGSLGRLYQEIGYFDLALHHRRAYQQLAHALSPPGGGAAADASPGSADDPELSRFAEAVAEREAGYNAKADTLRVMDRALLAYGHGLAEKARDVLLESDVAAFGPEGLRLELELLLRTGRSKEVAEWTGPDTQGAIGTATYHWLRIQAFAAEGDYALAEEECDVLASSAFGSETSPPVEVMALLVGQAVLDEQPVGACVPALAWRSQNRLKLYQRSASLAKDLRQAANANVFRGLLALEEGNMDNAEIAFRLALALWQDDAAVPSETGLDFNARPVAEAALRWLQ